MLFISACKVCAAMASPVEPTPSDGGSDGDPAGSDGAEFSGYAPLVGNDTGDGGFDFAAAGYGQLQDSDGSDSGGEGLAEPGGESAGAEARSPSAAGAQEQHATGGEGIPAAVLQAAAGAVGAAGAEHTIMDTDSIAAALQAISARAQAATVAGGGGGGAGAGAGASSLSAGVRDGGGDAAARQFDVSLRLVDMKMARLDRDYAATAAAAAALEPTEEELRRALDEAEAEFMAGV